jgi:hypothetical protein
VTSQNNVFTFCAVFTFCLRGFREDDPNDYQSRLEEERFMKNNGRKIFLAIIFAILANLPFIAMAVTRMGKK